MHRLVRSGCLSSACFAAVLVSTEFRRLMTVLHMEFKGELLVQLETG
jgi:hypothetical protein